MYKFVLPCELVLVNKLHEAWFVFVTNVSLLDVSFFCFLFNVARLCLYGSGEKHETLMHILRTRGEQIPPTSKCPAVQENTDGQQSDKRLGRR